MRNAARCSFARDRGCANPPSAAAAAGAAQGVRVEQVFDLVNRIAVAETVTAVWDLATGHFRAAGFGRANYGLTRLRQAQSMGPAEDALYLTTLGADYAQFYFAGGFYARTPLYRWALENTGCCTWRWVDEALHAGTLSPDEAAAVRQNAALGICAGLTISFPAQGPREKGALGLVADPGLDHDAVDAICADQGAALLAVAHVMHLRLCQLPHSARRRSLSPRQREALQWVAEGKTTQDTALLMGVTPTMVEKHLKLARAALDVETTAQAVAKATLLRLIFAADAPPAQPEPPAAETAAALPPPPVQRRRG